MRTKTLLLSAAALVAGIVGVQAQSNVFSANVVGYVSQSLPANPPATPTFTFSAVPLDTGNNVLTNLFQSLPNGSKILRWDYPNAAFDIIYTRSALPGGWSPSGAGSNVLNPGEAFFVELNSGNVAGFTNTYVGTALQGTFTNNLLPGFSAQSVQTPVALPVTNSILNLNAFLPSAPAGSKLLNWDNATQAFDLVSTRNALPAGWSSVPSVSPGVGFFVFNAASTNRAWVYSFTVQ